MCNFRIFCNSICRNHSLNTKRKTIHFTVSISLQGVFNSFGWCSVSYLLQFIAKRCIQCLYFSFIPLFKKAILYIMCSYCTLEENFLLCEAVSFLLFILFISWHFLNSAARRISWPFIHLPHLLNAH